MQRTISLKLEKTPELLETISVYNQIVNIHIKESFVLKTNSKKKLHNSLYKYIRKDFPAFPSALIQCARDNCVEMLKGNKYKEHTIKKDVSSIRFDLRTIKVFLDSGNVSITTIQGRKKYSVFVPEYFSIYKTWKVKGATLGVSHKFLRLQIIIETDNPTFCNNKEVLGIDLGIKNFAVISNNTFIKSKKINRVKRKYAYLRSKLQSRGTHSSKRRLKLLSGRERRFQRDFNHCLSKQITNMPYGVFAMEELKNIRNGRKGRVFNRKRSNWAYFQLRSFISYKAENLGKHLVLVDPHYTSQRCSKCGFIDKANRNKSSFHCLSCDFVCHSDLNASYNISQIGAILFEQALVNEPIVAVSDEDSSLQNNPLTLVTSQLIH
jgi:IS605 OrfB family transposase